MPRVAVLEFQKDASVSAAVTGTALAVLMENALSGRFRRVTRSNIAAAMNELKFQASDMVDDSKKATEFGRFLGVDYLVTGTVVQFGKKISVVCQMIKVDTGVIRQTADVTTEDVSELLELMRGIAPILAMSDSEKAAHFDADVNHPKFLADGRRALDSGDAEGAMKSLRQAIQVKKTPEADELLKRAEAMAEENRKVMTEVERKAKAGNDKRRVDAERKAEAVRTASATLERAESDAEAALAAGRQAAEAKVKGKDAAAILDRLRTARVKLESALDAAKNILGQESLDRRRKLLDAFKELLKKFGGGDYIVVDLASGRMSDLSDLSDVSDVSYRTSKLLLRRIPAGTFTMGSPPSEAGRDTDEAQHEVTLTKDFYIGVFEVTQGQWEAVMGSIWFWKSDNPSNFKNAGESAPVEQVSWNDCQDFIEELNAKTNGGFRLPTEAEWEYACRARTTVTYAGIGNLNDMGWYSSNSGTTTHPVGQKKPNAWGLYDMHGNVWEWCSDWKGNYSGGGVSDPTGAATSSRRMIRGGSWFSFAAYCRSASRSSFDPANRYYFLGFRLVLPAGL